MSLFKRNFALAGGLGIMLLAAACGGDGTGPRNSNPAATAAKLEALGSAGLPATPLHEIGYADFKDESTPTLTRLHIVVVANGTTYVDYTLDTAPFNLTMVGFVRDGSRRLDFGVTLSGTTSVISEEMTFDINAENAHVRLTATIESLSETSYRSTLDYRFQFGADVATVSGIVNQDGSVVTGGFTLTLNGRDIATYDAAGGQWSRPGGGALSQD